MAWVLVVLAIFADGSVERLDLPAPSAKVCAQGLARPAQRQLALVVEWKAAFERANGPTVYFHASCEPAVDA